MVGAIAINGTPENHVIASTRIHGITGRTCTAALGRTEMDDVVIRVAREDIALVGAAQIEASRKTGAIQHTTRLPGTQLERDVLCRHETLGTDLLRCQAGDTT